MVSMYDPLPTDNPADIPPPTEPAVAAGDIPPVACDEENGGEDGTTELLDTSTDPSGESYQSRNRPNQVNNQ